MEQKKKLIVLTGPTAVGKTELSIQLAKKVGGEIISADSMQVYKYMDIGSAKIMPEEMQGVRHHLVDVLHPKEAFDVYTFKQLAKEAMQGIYERGNIPVIVGGTGFYIQALLYDIDFTTCEEEDQAVRKELEKDALNKGNEYLHEMLKDLDEESARQIHPNNVKRMIRAIEYCKLTGSKFSEHNEEQRRKESPYDFRYFVLNDDRKILYERIDKRVDIMLKAGLLEEVKKLKDMGLSRSDVSMQGLGYKEILDYLDGEIDLERAVYLIKRDTRHFAKRQLTWFRRERDVIWVNKNEYDHDETRILEAMLKRL